MSTACNFIRKNNNSDEESAIDRKRKVENATSKPTQKARTQQQQRAPPPKFTVTYSRLCDGGTQEMSTAVSCVRDIFPDATIRTNRRRQEEDIGVSNPTVVISTASGAPLSVAAAPSTTSPPKINNDNDVLWSSKQRNLYEKYPKKRKKSMSDIRKTLEKFKISLQQDFSPANAPRTPSPEKERVSQVNIKPQEVREVSAEFNEIVDACELLEEQEGSCCKL